MQLAEATKEKGVVMTSSPGAMLAASMARWRPAVPEETATACFRPVRARRAASNCSALGPMERVGVWRTSTTASMSRWVMSGRERGIWMGMGLGIGGEYYFGTGARRVREGPVMFIGDAGGLA